MKIIKRSIYNEDEPDYPKKYLKSLDFDIQNIATAFQGLIRFGGSTTGFRGENINGEFRVFTSSGSANAEFSVSHTLGAIPQGRIIMYQDKAGSLYQGPSTGTAWTTTTAYFKCDVASVTFCIFLLK